MNRFKDKVVPVTDGNRNTGLRLVKKADAMLSVGRA